VVHTAWVELLAGETSEISHFDDDVPCTRAASR
jgi:hypothetical protein